ncbi:MAG: YcjX family protein [Acetobacteraceae bacterium]
MTAATGLAAWAWSGVRDMAETAAGTLDATLNEHRIRLAVTGLSRSGKTVFITSLIQNLLALGHGRDTLPLVSARLAQAGHTRLRSVRLVPTGVETLPHFDFRGHFAALAAQQPAWPRRTQNLAQISLVIEADHASGLRQRLGRRRVRLDILDYPGEWLLDLPLLDRSFADWSRETLAALAVPPRQRHAAAFLDFLRAIAPGDRQDDGLARRGHDLYRRSLEACRDEAGLHYLQPGRFLCPGPQGEAPFLWFFPLPGVPETPAAGSLGALLRDRFETYKRQIRADFFDTHFRAFDRQVVLVDVLGALHAGQAAFEDTARAILDLAQALRDGWGFWSRRRWLGLVRPIEHVAFVATKADHVPALNRTNLRNLLEALAQPAARSWETVRAPVSYHAAAAIRSTEDGSAVLGGRTVEVVKGVVLGEDRVRPFYVGQVPSAVPPASFWTGQYFAMPVFRPPLIDASGTAGIRHLGLDEVLDAVIGDLL